MKETINKVFKHLKEWRLLYFVAVVSILFIVYYLRKNPPFNKPIQLSPVTKVESRDKTYSLTEVEELTNRELKRVRDSFQLYIKGKLKTAIKATVIIDTVFAEVPVYIDTSGTRFTTRHSDPWMDIQVNGNLKTLTSEFSIKHRDTITMGISTTNPLFKRGTTYLSAYTYSPYTDYEMASAVTIRERRVIGTIGPFIGVDITTLKPTYGVAYSIPLIVIRK